MNSDHASGGNRKSCPRTAPGMRALFLLAISVLLLSSACAKRPEVVATAPPPTAGGPIPQERGEQGAAQPGIRTPGTEPGTMPGTGGPSAGGPSAAGPRGGPEGGPMAQKPGEGVAPGIGGGPSTSMPPGSEMIAPQPSPPREEPVARVAQLAPKESPLKDIFFDFDKAEIRPDAKTPLAEDIAWLKAHPQAAITIEGHCDERGTSEYNLGLGERRAKSTKDFLVASAIDGKRITTVSYGKERPFVLGHDETAWKWNRRAHFLVTKQ